MLLITPFSNLFTGWKSLNALNINLSLTFKFNTNQPAYLYDLISLQPSHSTRSSSVVTLARPPTRSTLKSLIALFDIQHLVSGINFLTLFVSHDLICLLIHLFFLIISAHQFHHHHSHHPSLLHSFILASKRFHKSFLHRPLVSSGLISRITGLLYGFLKFPCSSATGNNIKTAQLTCLINTMYVSVIHCNMHFLHNPCLCVTVTVYWLTYIYLFKWINTGNHVLWSYVVLLCYQWHIDGKRLCRVNAGIIAIISYFC